MNYRSVWTNRLDGGGPFADPTVAREAEARGAHLDHIPLHQILEIGWDADGAPTYEWPLLPIEEVTTNTR